ncbi:5-formyltetrahydrofolate cyclo-ligase [Aquibacillus rhizosphaerae]|uniref:5-formyltetrahydrofolate cyclo-ligase n=1 Tax=Aquibacillus rhizosphaerae TaxID=3051431 RepID=A0ABT7LBL5_9BACI|nr:5-formyltetrahydrofolate cyclo-ligase [Aquibacillus sp. LR5S19]MDL4843255.1 5-formyltetrahydrofolate cyclo-ligase [Aquibacillus sp. LR5S19]
MVTKQEVREEKWKYLTDNKLGRFPFPLQNRIPNFKGAEKAAHFVTQMPEYQNAKVIKVNPDAPQLPIRAQILKDMKTLLVPTPRLKAGFIIVKPAWVPTGEERRAASLSHIKSYGKEIALDEIPNIDLFFAGSVALNRDGRRIGKGEGYADREYAIIRELGNPDIPVIGTIHSAQLTDKDIPIDPFDLTVDWIATEKELIKTDSPYKKPNGIQWDLVTEEELEAMPVLREIQELTRNGT